MWEKWKQSQNCAGLLYWKRLCWHWNEYWNWKVLRGKKCLKSLENHSPFVFFPSDLSLLLIFWCLFQLIRILAQGGTTCAFGYLALKMYVSILTPWVEVALRLKHDQRNCRDPGTTSGAVPGVYHHPSRKCDKCVSITPTHPLPNVLATTKISARKLKWDQSGVWRRCNNIPSTPFLYPTKLY